MAIGDNDPVYATTFTKAPDSVFCINTEENPKIQLIPTAASKKSQGLQVSVFIAAVFHTRTI